MTAREGFTNKRKSKKVGASLEYTHIYMTSDVKTLDDHKNMKIRPKYDHLLPKKATKIRLLGALKGD